MVMEQASEWRGTTPWYLLIEHHEGQTRIDLDEPDWATTYADLMRAPGVWVLVSKANDRPPLMLVVHQGEQPYYTARHVGITSSAGGNEIVAYGIGKKRPDGVVQRIWIMPNGVVCSGDDVDDIGVRMVKALGPK